MVCIAVMSIDCKNAEFILTHPINKRRKLLNVLKCVLELKDGRKDVKEEQALKLRFVSLQIKWHYKHPFNGMFPSVRSFDCLNLQWFS